MEQMERNLVQSGHYTISDRDGNVVSADEGKLKFNSKGKLVVGDDDAPEQAIP
jgi:flagellar hook protein FlgE